MSMTIEQVEEQIRTAVLSSGTYSRVVFHYPNAPRPELPYTTLRYVTSTPAVNDWEEFDMVDDINRVYGFRSLTFSVNCYGFNAWSECARLQGKLRTQQVREELRFSHGIAINEMTAITDLSSLIDDEYERRANFDIILNVNIEDGTSVDDVGYFDHIESEWDNKPST